MRGAKFFMVLLVTLLAGCVPGFLTDAATRIAYDIEAGAGRLGGSEGSRVTINHATPSKSGECEGPYKLQVDKVGMLVIWCLDAAGKTVSSHTTSYFARFVDTPQTWILDKPSRAPLVIEIERRNGRATVADVR
jgi:hypothetical protein